MSGATRIVGAIALLLISSGASRGQDTVVVGARTPAPPGAELPAAVAAALVDFYNNQSTIRFSGRTRIPAERTIGGDMAVLGGPVELAGTITGDVVVVNGDITLLEGSRISGDLTVVGGIVVGSETGRVDGLITTYASVFRYRHTEDGIEYLGSAREREPRPRRQRLSLPTWELGESEIYLAARPYNRTEGLPLVIGPRIQTGGSNPLSFEAFLIWRTQSGFDPDQKDIGWELRLRQYLGGHRSLWVEGTYWSVVDPIENWKLTNLENSLSLFLFRRDYRDYYKREGWYGRLGWQARSLFGSFEYRNEKNRSLQARSPWTIFFNTKDEFRPNTLIDDGDLQSLVLTVGIDTRNDSDDPWSGWLNELRLEQAIGGQLSGADVDFTHFFLDIRRYNRVSRGSVLGLRLVGGGRIGTNSLPAQREHVIGGVGSLPGYSMLQFDCGVRGSGLADSVPGYGCQRFTLFQAEYRTGLRFNFHWNYAETGARFRGDPFSVHFDPAVVLFYNAGAAWDTGEGFVEHLGKSDNWVADVGAGLDFGGLGLYLAYPLVGSGGLNFFVRLTRRF